MKLVVVDDGFDIIVVPSNRKNLRGADVFEAPKGVSLWEGATCIMQDCSEQELKNRIRSEISDNINIELQDYISRDLIRRAKGRGYITLRNKANADAPYLIVFSD